MECGGPVLAIMLTFCLLVSASLHCHPHFEYVFFFFFFFRIWLSFFPSQIHLHPPTKTDMEPENSPLKRATHWPKHQHFLGSIVRFFGGFTPQTWGILLLMAEIRLYNQFEVGSLIPMIYEVLAPSQVVVWDSRRNFWTIHRLICIFPWFTGFYTSQVVQDFILISPPHFFNPSESSCRPPSRLLVEVFGYWSDYRWRPHVDRRWGIRSTGGCWVEQKKILGKQNPGCWCGNSKYFLFVSFSPRKIGGRWFNILTHIFQRGLVWNHQLESTKSSWITLQETNISPKNGILKMIFLFPRWDMLIPWRVPPPKINRTGRCGGVNLLQKSS